MACLRVFRLVRGRRDRTEDPLLVHADGTFLSRFQFVAIFCKGFRELGLCDDQYTGHSFCIGAATEAASLGFGKDLIKRIGRWESVRFRSYVRLNRL